MFFRIQAVITRAPENFQKKVIEVKEMFTNDSSSFTNYRRHDMRTRLNLVAAAEAHVLWKTRLGRNLQEGACEPLESVMVGQDGVCQLGGWISGSVFEPFRELDVYQRLSESHRQFHELGRGIVEKLKVGDRGGAEAVFNNEYSLSLHGIVQSLTEINKLLQED